MALEKIRLERMGVFEREQHRGEHFFAAKGNRLAPEFKLPPIVIFGRHLFEFELRQRVAVGDFDAAAPESKITRFLSAAESSLYCALTFSASPASRT